MNSTKINYIELPARSLDATKRFFKAPAHKSFHSNSSAHWLALAASTAVKISKIPIYLSKVYLVYK